MATVSAQKTARNVTAHRWVALNEAGRRVGETHPQAKLTDHDIDLMFALRAAGMGTLQIALKFDISDRHARRVLNYRGRNHTPAQWRRVGGR